jgi:3-mercaptopyruvate sulfurtransferase SseA
VETRRLPGALTLTLRDLESFPLHGFSERQVVLYCACPNEASAAAGALVLHKRGYAKAKALRGGLEAWIAAGHEVEAGRNAAVSAVTVEGAGEISGRRGGGKMLSRDRERVAEPRPR